ncbi:hypothetical protein AOLI_G00142360 [Acnodon oligacanthus]
MFRQEAPGKKHRPSQAFPALQLTTSKHIREQSLDSSLGQWEESSVLTLTHFFIVSNLSTYNLGELSEDVEAASETTTDQEDQTKDRESGGEKELTKGTVCFFMIDGQCGLREAVRKVFFNPPPRPVRGEQEEQGNASSKQRRSCFGWSHV